MLNLCTVWQHFDRCLSAPALFLLVLWKCLQTVQIIDSGERWLLILAGHSTSLHHDEMFPKPLIIHCLLDASSLANLHQFDQFYYVLLYFPPHGNCKRSSEEGKIGLFHKVKISFLSYVDLSVGVSDCFTVWGQLLARDVISWIIPINWPAALQHCSTIVTPLRSDTHQTLHSPGDPSQ